MNTTRLFSRPASSFLQKRFVNTNGLNQNTNQGRGSSAYMYGPGSGSEQQVEAKSTGWIGPAIIAGGIAAVAAVIALGPDGGWTEKPYLRMESKMTPPAGNSTTGYSSVHHPVNADGLEPRIGSSDVLNPRTQPRLEGSRMGSGASA
eukprot:TRINITY_DN9464_c0_g1_i1.p1 TRINITY_DN9464_c0_g1~~TRINITY_DN9464_c0_g1_i1.p1  ORF type:complete len:147 (-),score=16.53 TRINITY_DN9464_c0_g1_i1:57-497(-)